MRQLSSKLGLPLLAKELIEQAARKRTYAIRVVYATLLFLAAFLFFYDNLRVGTASPLAVLGRGRELFEMLVLLQFVGIYLFMPAITCGVLTLEKERASLPLLFLTRLGPWTIVLEKLMGRVIPMVGFLLLSLPLLAFAYSLGGITVDQLGIAMGMLILTIFQMGTLALMCSAFFRTTVGAFTASYGLVLLMLFGPMLVWFIAEFAGMDVDTFINSFGGQTDFTAVFYFPWLGCALLIEGSGSFLSAGGDGPLAVQSGLIASTSALCLVLARYFTVRRAFLPPRNILLTLFKAVDGVFQRLNDNRFTRGIVLGSTGDSIIEGQPVAWRETHKRSLGRARYLVRIFLALEIPTAMLCFIVAFPPDNSASQSPEIMALLLLLLWGIAVLMVAVQSASLIAGEKTHQTLAVLCTTPLSGREIILQKYRSVRRLMFVLAAPLATIFSFHCAATWGIGLNLYGRKFDLPVYLAASALSVSVYLPLTAWVSLAAGLKFRTQSRAIIGATAGLVAWYVAPLVFVTLPLSIIFEGMGKTYEAWTNASSLLSPATIIVFTEFDYLHGLGEPWVVVLGNFGLYAALLAVVRYTCLRNADRWLGRTGGKVQHAN